MNRRCIAAGVLVLAWAFEPTLSWADRPIPLLDALRNNNVVLSHTWQATEDVALICAVTLPSHDAGPSDSKLVVYEGNRSVLSFTPRASPLSIFSTSELKPRLVTVWVSGSGAYLLFVYAYVAGKVTKVLEAGSKMFPEFVYPATSAGDYNQRIIVSSVDWVVDPASGESRQQPVTADIYVWDGKTYQVRRGVPWKDRLIQQ